MERVFIEKVAKMAGKTVKVSGWVHTRRDHGKLIFIDLRDRTGLLQIVFAPSQNPNSKTKNPNPYELARELRSEWVISIEGKINSRPKGMENPNIKTGSVEMAAEKLEILNASETPPFFPDTDGYEINEETRLKYRYLDLQRSRMKKNLESRHKAIKFMRDFLTAKGFIEVETPLLTKSTPEGARDYVVPSRLHSGKFYALPQSPQQYKQLLMVAGLERYFQIARCFRDEDTRGDRQPEFTQLDVEMSFIKQDNILNLIEELMTELTEKVMGKKIFQKPFPRFKYEEAVKQFGDDKFDLRAARGGSVDDGKDPDVFAFAWVVDFPLFKKIATREIVPMHHPFTAPKDEDIPLLDKDPMKARSWQHDLVCNGFELGGGSVRISNPKIQAKIFEILGHSPQEIEAKFGHLLEAFGYGVPPHGGIALGIDRLMALYQNEPNIREVIAFPKTGDGRDLMMSAPSDISKEQLKELRLKS
jgi:aspartyl-tRNA synthetase